MKIKEMSELIFEITESLSKQGPVEGKEALFVLISFVMKAETEMNRNDPPDLPWEARLLKLAVDHFDELNKLEEKLNRESS